MFQFQNQGFVQTGQTYKNAIKNGMKLSPAHLKIFKKAARNGAPNTNPTSQPLMVSVTNNPGVVLLNPCFSSRTKVWYAESGMLGIEETRNKIATKKSD